MEPQGAFGRRAVIERAKGILLERHSINEQSAFQMLRARSRSEVRGNVASRSSLPFGVRSGGSSRPRTPSGAP
ncbi:MAG: ANTAR domain-containing protein [Solirubrobacteraceae bacterium]